MSIGGGSEESADGLAEAKPRRGSYQFAFGPAFVIQNTAGSKGAGDNDFYLSDLNGFNDPTTTAVVGVGFPMGSKGSLRVIYGPFEARDEGAFSYDVNFGGASFPAGTELDSSWRYYDLNAYFQHALLDNQNWAVRGGVGAGIMYSFAQLEAKDGSATALVDDNSFYPYLGLELERRFSPKVALVASGEGMVLSSDWLLDLGAELFWRPSRAWDIALGYTYFSRKIESDTFYNKVNYNIPHLSISRFW